MSGLIFGKCVCTLISGNSGERLHKIKEDEGLRVPAGIRMDFDYASLDKVTELFGYNDSFLI